LSGARGFTIVDDDTLVFAPWFECKDSVKEIIADLAKPEAMLWLRVKSEEGVEAAYSIGRIPVIPIPKFVIPFVVRLPGKLSTE
jgi:hypothetical protein